MKIQTHKIIDTFLLKATIPATRTPKERGERSQTPTVFPAGHAARRVAPVAFLWEMHVLAIHTPRRVVSRAFIIRALPPRGCRKHGRPCENPAGNGAPPPMHDFRWVSDVTQDTRTLRERPRRETRGSERMGYARASTRTRDKHANVLV